MESTQRPSNRLTIRYRAPKDSKGKSRRVICTITAPGRIKPVEVDLVHQWMTMVESCPLPPQIS
jgi:hypothetical protein